MTRKSRPLSAYHHTPGEIRTRCSSCKQPFLGDGRAVHCFDCASEFKRIDDGRLMPDPVWRGATFNYTVDHVTMNFDHKTSTRPLAEGERRLGWFTLPPFQRPAVWSEAQRIRLIESMWLELPIGAYVFNRGPYQHPTDAWLIDGQQRVGALLAYVADEFPVFGYRFSEITPVERSVFGMKGFPAIQLSETDPAKLEDIYNRLAYGGTPHEPKG